MTRFRRNVQIPPICWDDVSYTAPRPINVFRFSMLPVVFVQTVEGEPLSHGTNAVQSG